MADGAASGESFQRQLDAILLGAQTRLNMEREHTDEMIEATRVLFEQRVNDLAKRIDERIDFHLAVSRDSLDERDKRHEQRFAAQELAVSLALARVDKEFHEHLVSARQETHAALDSADKAIHKQELAIEKRFDGVNEFRAQLSDQAQTFMPRKESDVRMDAITEKIDVNAERLNALQLQLSSRLDLNQGQAAGQRLTTSNLYAAVGALGGILTIIIIIATLFLNKTP